MIILIYPAGDVKENFPEIPRAVHLRRFIDKKFALCYTK